MNDIQIFKNETLGEVRVVTRGGEPWFVAADVCKVLDLESVTKAVQRLEEDEVNLIQVIDSIGRNQVANIVSESGLYSLILGSRKPEAKAFKRWITHEVIPAIRKTGGYVSNDDMFINTYLPHADDGTKALFKSTLENIRSLNAKIEQDKPKVLFSDSVSASHTSILVGELAKLLKQNGVNIGRDRLFNRLRNDGYLIKRKGLDYNTLTQRSMELGLFVIKETAINRSDGTIAISKTVRVTGKGQVYFINRYLGEVANVRG